MKRGETGGKSLKKNNDVHHLKDRTYVIYDSLKKRPGYNRLTMSKQGQCSEYEKVLTPIDFGHILSSLRHYHCHLCLINVALCVAPGLGGC